MPRKPTDLVLQSVIDDAIVHARGIRNPVHALNWLMTALGTPRELTQAEKDHALTLQPSRRPIENLKLKGEGL